MTVKSGGSWAGTFVTLDATGALATPSTGPAGTLYVDGVSNAATVTIMGSNPYKWSVTLPILTAGQRVDMYITATISTIATASVVASEQADTTILSDGVTVSNIATDALTAEAVKADAVTKIQNGLATPTNITAGTITTVTNLTNAPTDMAKESTLNAIKGATWSDETLVAIKAALDAIDLSGVAAAVWAAAVRTLTQSAASVAAAVAGSSITCQRGDSLSASLTDVGALTGYSKVYFTVKRDYADADTAAIIQIEKTAGLKYLNGAAGTPANGSLTIDDEASGDITIALDEVETAKLDPGVYSYDVQVVRTAGTVSTLTAGTFEVAADVTRATS